MTTPTPAPPSPAASKHRWTPGQALLLGLVLLATIPLWPGTAQAQDRAAAFREQLAAGEVKCPLDALVQVPQVFALTPDQLDALFAVPEGVEVAKNPHFQWMTTTRDRAVFIRQPFSNVRMDFTIFGGSVPVEEVTVDFVDGRMNGLSLSLYNRGDSGNIDSAEFQRRFKLCGQKMGEALAARPTARKANATQGLLSEGWAWISPAGMALLEQNPEAAQGSPEFLRLKLAPRTAKGAFAAAFQERSAAAKLSDLPRNVTRSPEGEVYIRGIPMVDQGPKGYCVVASAQRLFEYYGIPADQHQIAQVAGSDAQRGTNTLAMSEALGKIDYRFKTRFKILGMRSVRGPLVQVEERKMTAGREIGREDFLKTIRTYIDDGVPLLWGLDLGEYPEEPAIAQQASGGHMRMIIGYDDKANRLLFSDSWGAGHEKKRMTYDHAFAATHGLFALMPTVR